MRTFSWLRLKVILRLYQSSQDGTANEETPSQNACPMWSSLARATQRNSFL